jgi:hypothetical protein
VIRFWNWLTRKKPQATPTEESIEAVERAKAAREEVNSRWEEVHEVNLSLARLRARNHFAEGFRKSM